MFHKPNLVSVGRNVYESEMTWKEVGVTYFEVLPWKFDLSRKARNISVRLSGQRSEVWPVTVDFTTHDAHRP